METNIDAIAFGDPLVSDGVDGTELDEAAESGDAGAEELAPDVDDDEGAEFEDDDTEDDGDDGEDGEEDGEIDPDDDEEGDEDSEDDDDDQEAADEEDHEEELHEVVVDGQKAKVPLSELKNNYSGRKSLERKFQEFNSNVKVLKDKIARADELLDPVATAIEQRKFDEALFAIAEIKGVSRLDVARGLREIIRPIVLELETMHPSEREAWLLREENQFLKETRERQARKVETKAPPKDKEPAVITEIRAAQEETGASRRELEEAVEFLKANYQGEITRKHIAQVYEQRKVIRRAFDAIEAVNPDLAKNKKVLNKVIDKVEQTPDIRTYDLVQYTKKMREKYGKQKGEDQKELARDLSRKELKRSPKSSKTPRQAQKKQSALTFSDLR
jgi:hypothetical protein